MFEGLFGILSNRMVQAIEQACRSENLIYINYSIYSPSDVKQRERGILCWRESVRHMCKVAFVERAGNCPRINVLGEVHMEMMSRVAENLSSILGYLVEISLRQENKVYPYPESSEGLVND